MERREGICPLVLKTHLVYCYPLLLEPGYAVTGAVRLGFELAISICFQGQKGEWILGDPLQQPLYLCSVVYYLLERCLAGIDNRQAYVTHRGVVGPL